MRNIIFLLVVVAIFLAPVREVRADGDEPLYGIATDADAGKVSIVVASTGCTDKSYFSFSLEGDVLLFKRIKRDPCKAMPRRETLDYSLKELGIKAETPFRIGNPISLTERIF